MTVSKDTCAHPVSWSKNGFIAYSDHTTTTNLSISKLESLKGQSWRLSPKKTYEIKTSTQPHSRLIKTVSWSPSGSDLLVIDLVGNVSILGTGIVKTGTQHQLSCFEDIEVLYQDEVSKNEQEESLSKCIATKWINVDKPVIANTPAIFSDDRYNYSVHQYKPYGFLHPNSKAGCFVLRRDGTVDFYYQGHGVEFKKIRILLEPMTWVTEGSLGFLRDGALIVVTYAPGDQSLRVYKLTVDWNLKSCLPVFKVERLIMERLNKLDSNGQSLDLQRVDLISPNFSLDTELDILLTFTSGDEKSLLQKYQISNELKNLRFKSDMGSVDGYPNLVLLAEETLDERISNIEFKNFDFFIVITTKSGAVQLRTRKKLQLHTPTGASVSSLLDTGFTFKKTDSPPASISICPSLAAFVTLTDGVLEFHPTVKQTPTWDTKDVKSVAAGIAYLFCSACYTSTIADELIAVIQNELPKMDEKMRHEFIITTLKESHRALNFNLDLSKEQIDRLLVNPPMQRLLSLQYSLGKFLPSNEQSTMALALLNLRLLSFSIMVTLRTLFHQQQRIAKKSHETQIDAVYRSESVLSTVGTINWLMEFIIFTIQELMKKANNPEHKTVVVSLLVSTIPRSFLIYSLAGVKKIDGILTKVMEHHAQDPATPKVNLKIMESTTQRFKPLLSMVDYELFEQFLTELESDVIPKNKEARLSVEQELIFENKCSGNYIDVAKPLIDLFKTKYRQQPLSQIYTHETRWLKLDVISNTIPDKVLLDKDDPIPKVIDLNAILLDDVTKMQITNKERLKRCLRCEYIRGDNDDVFYMYGRGLTGTTNHWPVAYNRTCLCGSCWVYLSGDECDV